MGLGGIGWAMVSDWCPVFPCCLAVFVKMVQVLALGFEYCTSFPVVECGRVLVRP